MDDALYFSEQHLAVREMVRQFARDEVAPVAGQFDADATFPWENVKKMGELGLLGVPWPEEMGGAGLDIISYMIAIEELAKVDASTGLTISAHTTLGTSPIVNFGTKEQKERFVPLLASGKVLGGFGLTEPDAGSDAGGTRTTAVRRGGHYVAQRHQAVHHARQRRRDLHRHRGHRSDAGHQGHQLLHPHQGDVRPRQGARPRHRPRRVAHRDEGLPRRQEGRQARLARVGYGRAHHGGRRGSPWRISSARKGRAS